MTWGKMKEPHVGALKKKHRYHHNLYRLEAFNPETCGPASTQLDHDMKYNNGIVGQTTPVHQKGKILTVSGISEKCLHAHLFIETRTILDLASCVYISQFGDRFKFTAH